MRGRKRVSRAADVQIRVRLLAPLMREVAEVGKREGRSVNAVVAALTALGMREYRRLRADLKVGKLPEISTTGFLKDGDGYYEQFVSPERVSDAEFAASNGLA